MANDTLNISYTGQDDGEQVVVTVLQENFRLLITDFAGVAPPPSPIVYQRWIDETDGVVRQWTGAAWTPIGPRRMLAALASIVLEGAVSATRTIPLAIARPRFTVTGLKFYHLTATTSDASNKWTIDLRRDSDSASMFATPPTISGGGTELAAKTIKAYTPDQNQAVTSAGVSLVLTETGTAPTLTDLLVVLEGYEGNP